MELLGSAPITAYLVSQLDSKSVLEVRRKRLNPFIPVKMGHIDESPAHLMLGINTNLKLVSMVKLGNTGCKGKRLPQDGTLVIRSLMIPWKPCARMTYRLPWVFDLCQAVKEIV